MSAPPDPITAAESPRALAELNQWLAGHSAEQRVAWALEHTAGAHALSSSFGAQAAVSLHLVTQQTPQIPVILIDTGYLFPETYRFVDQLTERLALNLKVYRPQIGVAWMEARFGKLWESGLEGIDRYNRMRKVEPMQRALNELGVRTWIAGLRRASRAARAEHRIPGTARRPLEAAPHRRLERSRRVGCICNATTCPITRCGTRVTFRSATCTPRDRCSRA